MNYNYIKILVQGKNINNYIKWLIKKKINIINLNIIDKNKLEIIINFKDYKILTKYSKTYKINVIKKYGSLKVIEIIKSKIFILIPILVSMIFLYFLSNIIFSVDIIYNNKDIVDLIRSELKKYDIEKFKFKKDYNYLNKVKEEILSNNKDNLEWIEIVESGTKYIVKIVERKRENVENDFEFQSILSSKNAIITSIKASSGEKIKDINDYVRIGDVIVSGILTKSDGTTIYTKANAKVYGEVWYKVSIEYPLAYKEEKITGKKKDVLTISFLNKKITLFSYNQYKEFKVEKNNLIESNIIPFAISIDRQYEVLIEENIYTWDEAILEAINYSKNKLLVNNDKIINIRKIEIIDKEMINSKIKLNIFISVEEDITKIEEIKLDEIIENNLQS